MSSVAVLFLAALSCVNSEVFEAIGVLDGFANIEIDIGETQTMVTFTFTGSAADIGPGYGIGFGGTTMDDTYAVLVDVTAPSTLTTREVRTFIAPTSSPSRGYNEISGADNWVSTLDAVNAALILTRDNDVSSSCSDCYTFSESQTELSIIYAQGAGSLASGDSGFTNHQGKSKGGQTLSAMSTMGTTEEMMTSAEDGEYETCVEKTEIVSGVSVMIGRRESDKTMEITITGEVDKYSGVGFGATVMSGTYAIIVTGEETSDVMERTLGNHAGGDELTGDQRSFTSAESNTNDGTTQTVVIRRPYSMDSTFDFTDLLTCEDDSIDAIAAQGSSYTFSQHASSARSSGTLERSCKCGDDDSAANNIYNVFHICLVLAFAFYFVY